MEGVPGEVSMEQGGEEMRYQKRRKIEGAKLKWHSFAEGAEEAEEAEVHASRRS